MEELRWEQLQHNSPATYQQELLSALQQDRTAFAEAVRERRRTSTAQPPAAVMSGELAGGGGGGLFAQATPVTFGFGFGQNATATTASSSSGIGSSSGGGIGSSGIGGMKCVCEQAAVCSCYRRWKHDSSRCGAAVGELTECVDRQLRGGGVVEAAALHCGNA
eukprot:GHVS01040820.1.p1 GENE.GHVS01040820.1~~GHVS01040820.1.p1  ORF type:complete len:163 (-),score=65.62 GHVS01040820.1:15-503(-)